MCVSPRETQNNFLIFLYLIIKLALFDMGMGMKAPHHNFVVINRMIMKFGTGIKRDVFYTTVAKSL